MNNQQLLLYSRQIMLPQIDIDGQRKLSNSSILIIGAGGLGSPIAMYLAAAGIGTIHVNDFDQVELSNTQRQIAHKRKDVGQLKTTSITRTIQEINPECEVIAHTNKLTETELLTLLPNVHAVCDGSDNFETRFLINSVCKKMGIPLISGAAIRWEGQLAVFSGEKNAPCYQCLYPRTGENDTNCTNNGVISPLVGVIGSMQALETIKILTQSPPQKTVLTIFDALHNQWRQLNIKQDPQCPVCHPTK